jgi:Tol biopolymer transport system component
MVVRLICGIVCSSVLLVSGCSGSSDDAAQPKPSTEATPKAGVAHGKATPAGRLLFSRFDENTHTFQATYVAGPDGSHVAEIAMPGSEGGGRWSRSGDLIAVMTLASGGRIGTAILKPDGTVVRTFTLPDKTLNLVCTVWSPDDKRLACEGWDDTNASRVGIYTVRSSDGGGLVRLTKTPPHQGDLVGDYSPDGRTFLFKRTTDELPGPLMVVPVAGGPAKLLTDFDVEDPGRYSPDGTSIVTSAVGVIKILDVNGRETGRIEQPGTYSFGPVWSPDGERIAFSRTVGGFHADIFTSLPDGTDRHQVTATPDNEIRVEWGRG